MRKRTIIYIIGALVLVGVIATAGYYYQSNVNSNKAEQSKQQALDKTSATKKNGITYKGKDGVTALELLEQNAKIVASGTGKNAFVTSINGTAANPKNQYWSFNVNGVAAVVGAGSYVTKKSDIITWKLASF